ncbi:SNF-related serine/threonine-protein kinase [Oncorhynchus tshawytscha]|uniref:SNF-related serine/threonine-protein kinase n=1 Tax=Oncorhynchus tshawytscha TaxID=74940 RepID=A0AAZ3QVF6_ONCTS|nr:SNF-related serine/threonine-protein kinase [Oncorhynchus tshawytscha]XP_042151362.1 SNF-related serine/threonine-protein kinase [Oncorhynchus tshawytscha]XP_042151363.1 SNF-related serine/threonine-protein kinase [Oncorhynchus tshawytscha]
MAGFKRGHDGKIAGLYDLDKTLGRGHFAVVKLARHVFTGEKVAVKVIDKSRLDPVARAHLFQEVRCMKLVQHPNVVRLYEVIDTQTKLYLILELGDGGDMYDCIMKHDGGLTEEVAKRYFAQIVHAISYCHQLHVVHRDLKPENVVFFEKQGLVKLTDFGFSNKFQPGENLATSCGSLAYSAPEILLGDEYDAPAVDIWSLGVILFMLVCGHPPFQEANDSETLTMIMDCKYTVASHISSACRDLIDCMLQRDPKRRATVELIQGHDWLQGVDPSPATKLTTPLVSYRSLSEEEHGSIIQRMALGGIADRDTVTEALESDQYNHITATYFLLAERILREKQERDQNNHTWSSPSHKAQFRQSWPTRVDVHQDMGDGLGGTLISHPGGPQSPARSAESLVHHGPRPKTSLLELNHRRLDNNTQPTHTLTLQADDTHTTNKALPPVGSTREHQDRGLRPPVKPHSIPLRLGSLASPTPSKPRSPSLFSLDEEEEDEDEEDSSPSVLPSQVVLRHNVASSSSSPSSVSNRLTSRKSAPVLNQIHEEEGEEEEVEKDDKEKEGMIEGKKCVFKPEQAFLSLHTGILTSSGVSSPATVTKVATVAMASPTSERRDDNDSVSQRRPDMDTTAPRQGRPSFASGGVDRGWSGGDRGRESPSADGTGAGLGSAKAASGLVESLKLMSLCLSSQFHSLTAGGGGVRGGSLDHQDQPVWRMCMGGSTGSLDKVSLLGGPSPGGTHHLQHHPLDHFADPQFEAPSSGTLRLSELDLAREHHQNLKNRVLQMPLSDKTMSVNIHRSPKEGLLCPPSPHSCCQVI